MAKKKTLPVSAITGMSFPIASELPAATYEGIGKVIAAAAILEQQVSELLFDLIKCEYPEGRVAFKYAGASTMFSTIRRLLDLQGIVPKIDVVALEKKIKDECVKPRDQLAHGVWIKGEHGIALRITEGKLEHGGGMLDAAFKPPAFLVADNYYEGVRQTIMTTIAEVRRLKTEVRAAFAATHGK
jgi:hypothetical protein